MTRGKKLIVWLACLGLFALIAVPVYAQACRMCKTAGGEMIAAMESKSIDLNGAIAAAEKRSRGKALMAQTLFTEGKLSFDVYCWADKRIVRIGVDEEGKAKSVDDADTLPGVHDPVAHKPKPTPAG